MSRLEVDCTRRCRSRYHGQALTSALTKRSASNEALASFIKATCANFTQAFDFEGRTALHMSASRGRTELMEWLIRHSSEAFINARDRESGYTSLHRSIFYGQIQTAVALIKNGVNTEIVDKDDYKALDHAMLDRHYMYKHIGDQPNDVYVWGSNCNYTLGTGGQQPRQVPELLGCFSRTNTYMSQVCLGRFHSVWVGTEGSVWAGGQLARAGAPHATALRPTQLHLSEPCVQAATTLTSTVFLLQGGAVIQYALNSTDISQPASKTASVIKLPSVKPLIKLSSPLGVCAGKCHAVVWNKNAIYTWGQNLGQMGHPQEEKLLTAPKRVAITINNKEEAVLQLACASDAATVFTTSRGDVYLLHKFICKKIAIKQINLKQVCVEAKVSEQGSYSRVTVLLLTNVGQLHIWQDTTNRLTRCVFGLSHQTLLTTVALTHDALYFTTKFGEAFIGHISRKATPTSQQQPIRKDKEKDNNKSALVKFLEKDDCTSVKITKIPNVHRAVSIAVDNEGLNFACLQIKPTCGLTSIPQLSPSSLPKHMETLLETATEDDILHDVIFKVGTKLYPAHIYIVASYSDHLYSLYKEKIQVNPDETPIVSIDNVHWEVFDRILRFIYTGTCDVAELGTCALKIRKEELGTLVKKEKDSELDLDVENPSEISAFEVYKQEKGKKGRKKGGNNVTVEAQRHLYCDPVKLVQASAKRLQVMALHKLLDKFYYKNGAVCLKESASNTKNQPQPLDRQSLSETVDTQVCSKDGKLIAAHKCVLAARLEYFQGMFMHSWTESKLLSKVNLPIPYNILVPIINFLYTDSCTEVETSESIDFICSMLIVADQLFITRLREMCEVSLSYLVSLKNCAELCQFAHTYNATQLKQYCMEFISLNISSILENRSLDCLAEELLEDLSTHYCKFNPIMSSRVITPFYNAPTDETIDELSKNNPVQMGHTDEDYKRDDSLQESSSKKKGKSKKIEYTENEKARMRYESVSSVTSLDLSHNTSGDVTLTLSKITKETETASRKKQEKWIEVPSSLQKQQKVVQARLKAIANAKEILDETPTESFTKLSRNNSFGHIQSPNQHENSPRLSASPVANSPLSELNRSLQGNLVISHVGPKLSQKQRKKLASLSESSPGTTDITVASKFLESPPQTPKNPWKICEAPIASSSPNRSKALEFNQILADQKKQKGDYSRIMTKPLIMTQMEDKAIEDLERFYNVHEADDEMITVSRIILHVASPQWPHTATK